MMARAVIHRHAEIQVGATFFWKDRPLTVVAVHGNDPAAPVIVEELTEGYAWLKGQYALWSADGVLRALTGRLS